MENAQYRHVSSWQAEDIGGKDRLSWCLTDVEKNTLHEALLKAEASGRELEQLQRDDFPLAAIKPSVDRWINEVQEGKGLLVLRGLETDRYSKEQCAILYWGIGLYFGEAQSQSPMGDRLGHVVNVGGKDERERAYRNSLELALHTDASDIVGMMCLIPAEKGGLSGYSSGPAVYNHILKLKPHLIPVLTEGFRYHRFGEQLPGEPSVSDEKIPVFSTQQGYLSVCYLRSYIELAFDELGIAKTMLQQEALDYMDEIAHSPQFRFNFMMARGDIAFFNNYVVLHTRTEFFDSDDDQKKRHLLRLWLRAHDPRPIDPVIDAKAQRDGIKAQSGKGTYYKGGSNYQETPPPEVKVEL